MEGDRQPLQVRVEVVAQVGLHAERGLAHHPAPDQQRDRLEETEQQGQAGEWQQGAAVVGADRVVDHPPGDQGHGRGASCEASAARVMTRKPVRYGSAYVARRRRDEYEVRRGWDTMTDVNRCRRLYHPSFATGVTPVAGAASAVTRALPGSR